MGFPVILASDPLDTLPNIAITQDMLTPIAESIVSNVGVILPICVVVFGILLGIKLIPKLFSRFVH